MKSKKSFFEKSLFKANIKRYWLIWTVLSVLMCLVPAFLYSQSRLELSHGNVLTPKEVELFYKVLAVVAVPITAFLASALVGVLLWNYLYTQRSVGFFHTIPVSRNKLFVTNYLSGLAILLIPYLFAAPITMLVVLGIGAGVPSATFELMFCVLCETILFFSIATVSAHITGNIFGMGALYLTINFLSTFLTYVASRTYCRFVLGVYNADLVWTDFLSPLTYILSRVDLTNGDSSADYIGYYHFNSAVKSWMGGIGAIAVYGIIGLALCFLSLYLYKKRKSEVAGDFAAFGVLRPAFIGLFSAVGGLTLASLVVSIVFNSREEDPWLFLVVSLISVTLAYYVTKMIIEKSFFVFTKKSIKGLVALWIIFSLFTIAAGNDIFKVAYSHPALEEIDNLSFNFNAGYYDIDVKENEEIIKEFFDFQNFLADRADEIKERNREYENDYYHDFYFDIEYHVAKQSNSRYENRDYRLKLFEEDLKDPDSIASKLLEFLSNKELYKAMMEYGQGYEIDSCNVYGSFYNINNDYFDETLWLTDAKELYDAIMKDIDAGRVKVSSLNQLRISPPIEVYFDLKVPASERMSRRYTEPGTIRIQITKDMTESLKVIEKYSKKSYDELMKMYEDHYNEYSNDYSVDYSEDF